MATLIIPAAGSGTRFGAAIPKQLLLLAGIPVIRRSLDAFAGLVDAAVIACAADQESALQTACAGAAFPLRFVRGGATRQASVHAALRAVPAHQDVVLVHDAVRPFVPRSCITACLAALATHDGAVVALPCSDTVKRAETETPHRVGTTIPREGLWLAQTPQGLRRASGLAAFDRAEAEGWSVSDDVQVLEKAGLSVALVPGDRRNLKITTPEDWTLAEALVQIRPTSCVRRPTS